MRTASLLARKWDSQRVADRRSTGTGSGFIWDEQGHVVTNYHVVEDASRCKVTLADQTTWDAALVGEAPDKDLAVLKISAPAGQLRPLLVGTSSDLEVGQKAFAIGSPFGLQGKTERLFEICSERSTCERARSRVVASPRSGYTTDS